MIFFFFVSQANSKGELSVRTLFSLEVSITRLFHIYHSLFPVTTSAGSPFHPLLCGVNNIWIKKAFQVTIKRVQEGVDTVYVCVFV